MSQPKTTPRQAPRSLNQRLVVIGFTVVVMLALVAFAVRSGARSTLPIDDQTDPANPALIAQGKQLYDRSCASCHGTNLEGQPGWPERRPDGVMPASPLNETGTVWQRDDDWIFATIKHGGQATASPGETSYMPAFGGSLTDQEIRAIMLYMQSTWPERTEAAQPVGR